MAKGFKHGAGGGNPLNFRVVGNPQPQNPKENTIWIDTDVPITGYEFSATEPEALIDGMVWISTGTKSEAPFNALKKNGIEVYPIFAKQYVSGALVEKTAKSYQNGAWVDWWMAGHLYSHGNEWKAFTGGLVSKALGLNTSDAREAQPIIITRNVDSVQFTNSTGGGIAHFANKIDLTDYNTLTFVGKMVNTTNEYFSGLAIWTEFGPGITSNQAASIHGSSSGATIDISKLNGEYYIGFWIYYNNPVITLESLILS